MVVGVVFDYQYLALQAGGVADSLAGEQQLLAGGVLADQLEDRAGHVGAVLGVVVIVVVARAIRQDRVGDELLPRQPGAAAPVVGQIARIAGQAMALAEEIQPAVLVRIVPAPEHRFDFGRPHQRRGLKRKVHRPLEAEADHSVLGLDPHGAQGGFRSAPAGVPVGPGKRAFGREQGRFHGADAAAAREPDTEILRAGGN